MNTKFLLAMGTVSALVFWIGGTIAGFIHGDYNPVRDTVSELGALGTKSHSFMTAIMFLSGLTGVLFSIGAAMACRKAGINIIPAIITVSVPLSTLWAATFPMGTDLHAKGGVVLIAVYIGVLLSLIVWRGERLKTLRIWSVISLALLLCIFLRDTDLVHYHEGLIQRLAHLGWSVWFIAINIQMVKLLNLKSLVTSH